MLCIRVCWSQRRGAQWSARRLALFSSLNGGGGMGGQGLAGLETQCESYREAVIPSLPPIAFPTIGPAQRGSADNSLLLIKPPPKPLEPLWAMPTLLATSLHCLPATGLSGDRPFGQSQPVSHGLSVGPLTSTVARVPGGAGGVFSLQG